MLVSFKTCNPLDFIQDKGHRATLVRNDKEGDLSLVTLDGSSEAFMDVMLLAIMDLVAEGKTIADIKYKGKGARRWFQMVFPPVLSPIFFGILDQMKTLIGYVVANKSVVSPARKAFGIALVKSWRGKGIGYDVIKHLQENLEKAFSPLVNELAFETSKNNRGMLEIGRKLGFHEISLPEINTWGDPASDRIRFLWIKP